MAAPKTNRSNSGITDLRAPKRPQPQATPVAVKQKPRRVAPVRTATPIAKPASRQSKPLVFRPLAALADGPDWYRHRSVYQPLGIAALIVGIATYLVYPLLSERIATAITSLKAGGGLNPELLRHMAEAGSLIIIIILVLSLIHNFVFARLVVHTSRWLDRRSVSRKQARKLSLYVLGRLTIISSWTIMASATVLAVAVLANIGFLSQSTRSPLAIIASVIVNILVLFILYGLTVSSIMSAYVQSLGQLSGLQAYKLGWHSYWHRLGSWATEMTAVLGFALVGIGLVLLVFGNQLLLSILVALISFVTGIFNIYFLRRYRFYVATDYSRQAGKLLASRPTR